MHNFKIKTSQCFGEGKFYLKFNELNELDELYLNDSLVDPAYWLLSPENLKSRLHHCFKFLELVTQMARVELSATA